ncbi:hypothetical protein TWF173_004956 [Orbilia oligospora]|nr:hypothetical protein TWF173_004956 [Orbilia oligospora]
MNSPTIPVYILVIRIYEPLLLLVNLVDLPGVFTNTIQGQSKRGMHKVQEMAKEHAHAQRKINLIVLVVNARVPFSEGYPSTERDSQGNVLDAHTSRASSPYVTGSDKGGKSSIVDNRRSSPLGRRKYLHDFAKKFETWTKEACQGTYRDENCKELHKVEEDCSACNRFFGFFRRCMDRNLLADVRFMNKTFFAFATPEFGKTKVIIRSANITKS